MILLLIKMSTLQQLVRGTRKTSKNDKTSYNRSPKLQANPVRKATITSVTTAKPKKPNSAIRKIVKARITKRNSGYIRAVIPGIGHAIKEFDNVLFRAGRSRDLPGMHYKLIRGGLSFKSLETVRRTKSRSKYGKPQDKHLVKIVVKVKLREKLLQMGYKIEDHIYKYTRYDDEFYGYWGKSGIFG
jgi:small subunit ribosomal protein S12